MTLSIKNSGFRKEHSLPLIEKYRAKSFSDIKGQDMVIEEIRAFFQTFPKKKALILNNQGIRFLRNHNWQGNISELKAIIQKIVCSTTGESRIITPEILAEFLPEKNLQIIEEEQSFYRFNSLKEATEEFEKQFLIYQLKKNHHDIAQLSNVLNLTTLQLRDKMLKFNIKYKI